MRRAVRLWGQSFAIVEHARTLEAALTCSPSERTQAKPAGKQARGLRARMLQTVAAAYIPTPR